MPDSHYQARLGEFTLLSLSDGRLTYPLETFFANTSPEQVETVLRQHGLPTDHLTTPYTCLFLNTGQHRVMIDTGAGNLGDAAPRIFPSVDHTDTKTGLLIESLRAAGEDPLEVDIVIITHAHPDHVGGTLTAGELTFPNARYFIPREEWVFWHSAEAEERTMPQMVRAARENLAALQGRLALIESDTEILPGVLALPAPGHTPGQIALRVTSAGESLLHIADAVLHPLHLEHPDWLPVFDLQPEQAAQSKRRIFDLAAEQQALVFAHHFPPFPNLGHVEKHEDGWRWLPISSGSELS